MASKRILVIGGTGAQGSAVVEKLLATEPPFTVRALSRDPDAPSVQEKFKDTAVELVKGLEVQISNLGHRMD
jgi:uncharacterized protein YbjT (DUF2867 family)